MATGTIKHDISTTIKYKTSDGLLIQWGSTTSLSVSLSVSAAPIYSQLVTITFHEPFVDNRAVVFGTFQYDTGDSWPFTQKFGGTTTTTAQLQIWDVTPRSGNKGRLLWTAIGRWK